MQIFRAPADIDKNKYCIVRYFLNSKTTLRDAAWGLAIGQSIGNPHVRNCWETDEMFEDHSCLILADEQELFQKQSGEVDIAFPLANIDLRTDGIAQLLCHVMGGQMDIDIVQACHTNSITFPPHVIASLNTPRFGIQGIRDFTNTHGKPLLGGIVKPKVGCTPQILLELVKQLVEGGVNFIKEDEIMSNPSICPLEERVPLIAEYLKDKNVIYAVCINSDPHHVLHRAKRVYELGGNAIHINFWSGLGVYKAIRDLDLPLFLFFQKSGDKILTNPRHDYHIKWNVICQLAGLSGVDFIHAGMWGGYLSDNEDELQETLRILHHHNVLPSLSCGMHPGLVAHINERFGCDYLANVGGAIHGHPGGTLAGTKAMRQAIDQDYQEEYEEAMRKWPIHNH